MNGNAKTSSIAMMVLLLAFFVQAIIPSGFMPGTAKDGYTTMVICSGMGEKTVLVPHDDVPADEQQADHAQNDLCNYQAASNQKILIDVPAFFPTPEIEAAASFDPHQTSTHAKVFDRAHASRAPPLFV